MSIQRQRGEKTREDCINNLRQKIRDMKTNTNQTMGAAKIAQDLKQSATPSLRTTPNKCRTKPLLPPRFSNE